MASTDFQIHFARFDTDLPDLRAVREPVFIVEQQVPEELEWDDADPLSVHVLARDADGTPIGTARLTPDHRIGRMAVLQAWRGRGVGAAMLNALIQRARELGYPELELHAQTHALGFYERHGFNAFGEEFDEAGIAHRRMRRRLEQQHAGAAGNTATDAERALLNLDNQPDVLATTLQLIQRARRGLCLYTRDLDPVVLDQAETGDALRRFATTARGAQVRVMAHDLRRAVAEGHVLIGLVQRLPSLFAIRVVEEEPDVQYASAFVLNDQGGYLFRPLATRFEASACLHDPARQRQLQSYFDEVWERARPATELRPL